MKDDKAIQSAGVLPVSSIESLFALSLIGCVADMKLDPDSHLSTLLVKGASDTH